MGADVFDKDVVGNAPIHSAAMKGNFKKNSANLYQV
jgi:ankyrin repeat protein